MPISVRFVVRSTILLLAIGFLALLGIVGSTIWLGERARIYSSDSNEVRDIRIAAVELRNAVQSAESSQRGFLVAGNEIYLAPYDNAKASALSHLDRLRNLLSTYPEYGALLKRLSSTVSDKISEMDQTIGLKRNLQGDLALGLFNSNRGKALMDEAHVFLSSIIRSSDERLITGLVEQRENTFRLRLVSVVGGLLIILVVAGVTFTIFQYAREVAQARDEVRQTNIGLEARVSDRTADLGRARDRAEALLVEVNHRVANSLALVASMTRLQSNAVADQSAKAALRETENRIFAISNVHKRLYSSGATDSVSLQEYLPSVLDQLQISMQQEGQGASLRYTIDPMDVATDAAINLGVVVTEWVTNAVKYAYPNNHGEIRITLKPVSNDRAELSVEDDGLGRGAGPIKGTGLGSRLVDAMATSLRAQVLYTDNHPGTIARLNFPRPNHM